MGEGVRDGGVQRLEQVDDVRREGRGGLLRRAHDLPFFAVQEAHGARHAEGWPCAREVPGGLGVVEDAHLVSFVFEAGGGLEQVDLRSPHRGVVLAAEEDAHPRWTPPGPPPLRRGPIRFPEGTGPSRPGGGG